jgi:speckle-type POZ protein
MAGAVPVVRCRTPVPTAAKGELVWEIEGISKEALAAWQNGEGKGKGVLYSSVFSVGGVEWRVSVYPNGSREEDRGYVSAFLKIMTPNKPVVATYSLTVGGDKAGPITAKLGRNSAGRTLEGCIDVSRGWTNLASHDDLERTGALSDDKLTIVAEVSVPPSSMGAPQATTVEALPEPASMQALVLADLGALLDDVDTADVTLVVGDCDFRAHSQVLSARSRMLKALLSRDAAESRRVELDGVDPEVFKLLLRHLYTGELPEGDADTPEMHQHLLEAADRFCIPSLLQASARTLEHSLSVESVGYTLVLADKHGAKDLKAAALRYVSEHSKNVSEHSKKVTETEGWEHLMATAPALLTEAFRALAGCRFLQGRRRDTRVGS